MSDNITVDGWSIYNLPIKYTEKDYDEARKELIDRAKNTPGLIALFEMGVIPFLGISDMDFWAVFADDSLTMRIPDQPAISEKTRYLMMHKFVVIADKHYKKMLFFDPWTTYAWPDGHRLLWQREDIKRNLNFEKINFSNEEKDILSAVYMEELLEAVYSNIVYYANKEISVRMAFETLKDCMYIIEEVNNLTGQKLDPAFTADFRYLGKNWFELKQEDAVRKLIDIMRRGLLVGFEASFALAGWFGKRSERISRSDLKLKQAKFKNCSHLDEKARNVFLTTFRDKRVFTDLVKNPEQAFRLSVDSYRKVKVNLGWRKKEVDSYIVFQPFEMAGIPLALVNDRGLFSDTLRNDIYTNQEVLPIFQPEIFKEKIKMINEITEMYDEKQRPNSDGKGFFAGSHRYGYQYNHGKLRRKLLNYWVNRRFWQLLDKLK